MIGIGDIASSKKQQTAQVPHEIRLIASASRLIDLHQSRSESGSVYIPDVPEKGGYYLTIALALIECLRQIEMDRGIGAVSISELKKLLRKRIPKAMPEDIEYCIASLKEKREIHYGIANPSDNIDIVKTFDTTPLLAVEDGFGQVQLTENARLLLRVASLRDNWLWLYGDIDAERLIKAIEYGEFESIPLFCRNMTLDITTRSKQLSGVMERPSISELRDFLLREGQNIAESLTATTQTIRNSIDLIFDARSLKSFDDWSDRYRDKTGDRPPFSLGNLQADLELVLQNAEALSRRFVQFVDYAQRVRSEGAEHIRFMEIAEHLVSITKPEDDARLEALLRHILPWRNSQSLFHPLSLVGTVDFPKQPSDTNTVGTTGYTLDPVMPPNSRFHEFVSRNRDMILSRLKLGPAHFSEILQMGGFVLLPGETPLDFFGVYAAPSTIEDEQTRIIVGVDGSDMSVRLDDRLVTGNDPIMFLEEGIR